MPLAPTLICDGRVAFAVVDATVSVLVIDVDDWDVAFVDALYDETEALHPRVPHSLSIVRKDLPKASARARLGERQRQVEEREVSEDRQITVLVTASSLARGFLTALGWMTRKQQTKPFAPDEEQEAVTWMAEQTGVSRDELAEALRGCKRALRDAA